MSKSKTVVYMTPLETDAVKEVTLHQYTQNKSNCRKAMESPRPWGEVAVQRLMLQAEAFGEDLVFEAEAVPTEA